MQSDWRSEDLDRYLQVAEAAAARAGDLLVAKMGAVSVREKNPMDFVTEADIQSEQIIRDVLGREFPDHGFLGEESVDQRSPPAISGEPTWIVDPLDGTTNYIHQLRSFSVSIALMASNRVLVGCVRDPLLDETYSAIDGGGAFLNGRTIQPSSVCRCEQAMAAVSLPAQIERDSVALEQLINVMVDSQMTVRRLGSTALNLCYLACGRLDAYWSGNAKIWDVAAGVLVLREAGAQIRHIGGRPFDWDDPRFIATSNQQLYRDLQRFLSFE